MFRLKISPFHDPYLNLALENALLETLDPREPVLFLYSNDPSVVLGRFQNPWVESSPRDLREVRLVRRQSGGGTVFHDRGNLNFSFLCSLEEFDKTAHLELIRRVLGRRGIPLSINERHDLTVRHQGEVYKVSGSAFRHRKDRAFHHGTLLIRTDKELLHRSISPAPDRRILEPGGTASHRSKVINLSELIPGLTVPEVVECFRSAAREEKELSAAGGSFSWETLAEQDLVRRERSRLQSREWLLEKTPPFKQDLSPAFPGEEEPLIIEIRKGVIVHAPERLQILEGLPYGSDDTEALLREKRNRRSAVGAEGELLRRLFHVIR